MEIYTKGISLELKESLVQRNVKEVIYGEKYNQEKEYNLQINNVCFKLVFIDITKIKMIIYKNYLLLINDLQLYIMNNEIFYEMNLESFYLGHIFYKDKLFIILQTEIISLDKKRNIKKKKMDFINDFLFENEVKGIVILLTEDCEININLNDI